MILTEGDKVRILQNGYDLPVEPSGLYFRGALAVVENVRFLNGGLVDYEISLLDESLHRRLSGGDEIFPWPFYADELEKVNA